MFKKLTSTVFTFSTIITVITILITTFLLYFFFSEQLKNELKDQMGFLLPGVEDQGESYLKKVKVPERITLISKEGEVIYDNYRPTPLENHLDRDEIKEALDQGEGSSVRYSKTLNEKTYYYAVKLQNGNILRIAMDQASLLHIIIGFLQIYLLIIIGAILLSYFISRKMIASIMAPIEELDPEHPLANPSYPELNPLLNKIEHQNNQIKEQIKEVNRQRADFETITANMNEGLIIIDKNENIKNINEAAKELLNIKISPADTILLKQLDSNLSNLINNALLGNKNSLILNQDSKTLSIIASPIVVMSEQTGIILIIIDITERAQMERLRSEYVANVSHELKTPLTSISGFAEIINNGLVKSKDIPHFADRIYKEAQHLIQMVNNILTLGYLDENNSKIFKTKVSLSLLAEEVIDRLQDKALSRDIQLKLIVKGDPIIIGNSEIITELLYNLVDNAIKYNKENGKVIVFINGLKEERVEIKVIDTGVGIPVGEKERIFERFYRPDKSRSNRSSGTGLGLSIVKHAALIHRATLSVFSKPAQGSIFKLEIPRTN